MAGLLLKFMEMEKRKAVWAKALKGLLGLADPEWARDDYGNLMKFSDYGDRTSPYGWELDHYPLPKSQGGSDELDNLRPLHWRANATHGGLLGAFYGLGDGASAR